MSKVNTGIILVLAYPETIVSHAEEWYSKYLRFIGIGNKKYVRAGHAALVLINRATGVLEYHDFGRYITPYPMGRVRGKDTDCELDFPLMANFKDNTISNLNVILKFLATHPKLTHGDGALYASVCSAINYNQARDCINKLQEKDFIRYAAFIKNACNCARFVAQVLINSTANINIKKKLIKSTRFTPSTVGNVVIADTENYVYKVSEKGDVTKFESTVSRLNRILFLDKLKGYAPDLKGTIKPKKIDGLSKQAQWLSGIAAGAWFELFETKENNVFRFKRTSPYGNIDVDALFKVHKNGFDYSLPYAFVHYSNCKFFHVKQMEIIYRFQILIKMPKKRIYKRAKSQIPSMLIVMVNRN